MIKVTYFDKVNLKDTPMQITQTDKMLFWEQENRYYCTGTTENLELEIDSQPFGITVPDNFFSNGANIPFFLKSILPPVGENYETPAYYHDFLYRYGKYFNISRLQADIVFYKLMKKCNVNLATRLLFFATVRVFGWQFYQN